jgi:hypothetical protein
MQTTTIASVRVSRIGLGTWAIGGSDWGTVPEEAAIATMSAIVESVTDPVGPEYLTPKVRENQPSGL